MPHSEREKINKFMQHFKDCCKVKACYGEHQHDEKFQDVETKETVMFQNRADAEKVKEFIRDLLNEDGFSNPSVSAVQRENGHDIHLAVGW
jgi:predicted NACHT family NTPase